MDININDQIDVFGRLQEGQLPIVYSPKYKMGFLWMKSYHDYDLEKSTKIANMTLNRLEKSENIFVKVNKEISEEMLLTSHDIEYLKQLHNSTTWAQVTRFPLLKGLPMTFWNYLFNTPLKYMAAGTIVATKIALETGWSINLGGGFTHCSGEKGDALSVYADIILSINVCRQLRGFETKIMIVDLDARQGTGYENYKLKTKDNLLWIFDMYNELMEPRDNDARSAINHEYQLSNVTTNEKYMKELDIGLTYSFNYFEPDFLIYIAGNGVLQSDPQGTVCITDENIKKRDYIVFEEAKLRKIPTMMLLGGGFKSSHDPSVISESISDVIKLMQSEQTFIFSI